MLKANRFFCLQTRNIPVISANEHILLYFYGQLNSLRLKPIVGISRDASHILTEAMCDITVVLISTFALSWSSSFFKQDLNMILHTYIVSFLS